MTRTQISPFRSKAPPHPTLITDRGNDPSAEDSRELAAHRLTILSGFPNTPAISSLDMRRNPAAAHEFRRNCLAMNDLAATLCELAQSQAAS